MPDGQLSIAVDEPDACVAIKDVYRQLAMAIFSETDAFVGGGGGTLPRLLVTVLCMIMFLCGGVKGIRTVTDAEVQRRIAESTHMREWYINTHGTCAANIPLFLKSIDLDTHQALVARVKATGRGVKPAELNAHLALDVQWRFIEFPVAFQRTRLRGAVTIDYRATIAALAAQIREIGIGGGGLITALKYPTHGGIYHVVAVWLTEAGVLTVIDPQLWARHPWDPVVLFADGDGTLERYLLANLHVVDTAEDTLILLSSIHGEIA